MFKLAIVIYVVENLFTMYDTSVKARVWLAASISQPQQYCIRCISPASVSVASDALGWQLWEWTSSLGEYDTCIKHEGVS